MRSVPILAALLVALAGPLSAQAGAAPLRFEPWQPPGAPATPAPVAVAAPDSVERRPGIVPMVMGGLVGSVVGVAVGRLTAEVRCGYYGCNAVNGLLVGAVGSTVLAAVGAHAGGGRGGRFAATLGGAAFATVAGVGFVAVTGDERVAIAIPLAQVAMAAWMELRTAR